MVSRVMLLKGWAMYAPGPLLDEMYELALHLARENGVSHICWDGDLLHESSFTAVIPRLQASLAADSVRFVCFTRPEREHCLAAAFSEVDEGGRTMTGDPQFAGVRRAADDADYEDQGPADILTTIALRDREGDVSKGNPWVDHALRGYSFLASRMAMGPVIVVCVGGGGAIRQELAEIRAAEADGSFSARFPEMLFHRLPGQRLNTSTTPPLVETVGAADCEPRPMHFGTAKV